MGCFSPPPSLISKSLANRLLSFSSWASEIFSVEVTPSFFNLFSWIHFICISFDPTFTWWKKCSILHFYLLICIYTLTFLHSTAESFVELHFRDSNYNISLSWNIISERLHVLNHQVVLFVVLAIYFCWNGSWLNQHTIRTLLHSTVESFVELHFRDENMNGCLS